LSVTKTTVTIVYNYNVAFLWFVRVNYICWCSDSCVH